MPIFASNFVSNSLSGTARVVNGFANIIIPSNPYALEGDKTFVIKLRKDSTTGDVLAISPTLAFRDNSSVVSLTANISTVAEGNLVAFTLVTANVPAGIGVYYSVFPVTANVTADDFVANTGTVIITNNAATFALQANADVSLVDETGETFRVQLRTNNSTGNVVYTTSNVVILDTYKTYNILGVTAGSASPTNSGDDVTFTFRATNVPNGTLFYYSTTGNVTSFTSNTGSFALNSVSNTFVISNPQVTANASYNVVVKTESQSGPIVATSNAMVVAPPPPPIYLWAWGDNGSGILGLGNTTNYSSPKQVGSLTNWSRLGAEIAFTAAVVKPDGSLWVWGGYAGYGALGLGDTNNRSSPVQVGALYNWASVDSSGHLAAIKTDGTLWTWGSNNGGRLGLGDTDNRSSPVQVGALTNWLSVLSSYVTTALKTDGTLWTWGNNSNGALGLGNTSSYSSPKQVGSLTNWAKISNGGYSILAIKTDGSLWTWGYNNDGRLGLGNTSSYSSPKQLGASYDWSSISAGSNPSSAAIKNNGTMWVWGSNYNGSLGLGDTIVRSSPTQVGALTTWATVDSGGYNFAAIKTDGTLWTWGWTNGGGHLGLGDTNTRTSPVQVGTFTNWLDVYTENYSTLAISTPPPFTVTSVAAGTASPIIAGTDVTYTLTGYYHTVGTILYYSTTGNVDSFTSNTGSFALNGSSNTFVISNPQVSANAYYNVVVRTGSQSGNVVFTSNTMQVTYMPPRYLWVWGNNGNGQLGLGDLTSRSSPVQVGTASDWASHTSTGPGNSYAIKTNGTLWAWGSNSSGQLGHGDTIQKSSPVQVGALTDWLSVSAGSNHVLALKTNGTMWSWGANYYGNLGQGNTTATSSPVQIGSLNTWSKITGGSASQAAIKTDGTLWIWGNGAFGGLGLGNETSRSSPVQIGALTTWSNIALFSYFGFAVRTDGTMWAWGLNDGRLGLGNTPNRSSPTQIGALTNWLSVSAGYNSAAIKTDGTMWAWGFNNYGEVGDSTTTIRSSPVQVGALTTWSSVESGSNHMIARKTDGTLWSWGQGSSGKLGLGNTTYYSSPKQIGALNTWLTGRGGAYGSAAIKGQ